MGKIGFFLLLAITIIYSCSAFSGQAITGKIIIDGVITNSLNSSDDYTDIIKGSGILGHEHRETSEFNSVIINGNIDVHYQRNNNKFLEITGDINLLPLIKTEVNHGVLIISPTRSYHSQLPLIIKLTALNLSALETNGSGNLKLEGLDQNSLSLILKGSGHIFAEGKINLLSINLSGSSNIDAKRLLSNQSEIRILGSGNVDIHAHEFLKADIMGSGNIRYYGFPSKIEKRILGSGAVESGN